MADRGDLVALVRAALEQPGEDLLVAAVAEVVEPGQQLACPGGIQIRLELELAQDLEVVEPPPRMASKRAISHASSSNRASAPSPVAP